jgi:hypothetical protein
MKKEILYILTPKDEFPQDEFFKMVRKISKSNGGIKIGDPVVGFAASLDTGFTHKNLIETRNLIRNNAKADEANKERAIELLTQLENMMPNATV